MMIWYAYKNRFCNLICTSTGQHLTKEMFSILIIILLIRCIRSLETKDPDAFIIPLYNRVNFIGCIVEIGTPPQNFELLLDTGSSVSWVVGVENPHCFTSDQKTTHESVRSNSNECVIHGTYNRTASSSFIERTSEYPDRKLEIEYYDRTKVEGYIGYEHLKIPTLVSAADQFNLELEKFQFGVGKRTNSSVGILALGVPEYDYDKGQKTLRYVRQNLILEAKKQGIIDRSVFSIWLDDRSETGEFLIGSIDEAKFRPPLYTTKLINLENKGQPVESYSVVLSGIKLSIPKRSEMEVIDVFEESEEYRGTYTSVLLDTGSKMSYLPTSVYEIISRKLTEHYDIGVNSDGRLLVDCIDAGQKYITIGFQFNTHVFNIPIHAFLERSSSSITELVKHQGDTREFCSLGILPQANNVSILGQAFFRSMYTVFDLDSMEVSIAPAKFTENHSVRKITFQEGINGVPDGLVDDRLKQSTVDPSDHFLMNTIDNGFYTYSSNANKLKLALRDLIAYTFLVGYIHTELIF